MKRKWPRRYSSKLHEDHMDGALLPALWGSDNGGALGELGYKPGNRVVIMSAAEARALDAARRKLSAIERERNAGKR